MSKNVAAQVAALPELRIAELKALWRDLYGKEPPPYNRPYLIKRLAYRLQELASGGLSDGARFKMNAVLQEVGANDLAAPRGDAGRRRKRASDSPVPGTRLVRAWQGDRHEVTVVADGFEYGGRPYRSLSAIARAITGTQWNGPAFFGLRRGGR